MEDTNWSKGSVRVVWEILPGDIEHIFKEISQEYIDPSLISPGPLINSENFPTIHYSNLNLADDYFDRVWTQSVIKINYQPNEWFDEYEP